MDNADVKWPDIESTFTAEYVAIYREPRNRIQRWWWRLIGYSGLVWSGERAAAEQGEPNG